MLYSSDEEDSVPRCSVGARKSGLLSRETSNPFKNFTVGGGSRHVETSRFSETQRGQLPSPQGSAQPLGQVEAPALIPEDEWAGNEGGVWVDGWLVDDMGQPPAKRKRRGGAESSLGSGGVSTRGSKGRLSLDRKGKERLSAGSGGGARTGGVARERSSSSVRSSGSSRRAEQSMVLLDSDSDDDVGEALWMGGALREEGSDAAVLGSSGVFGSSVPSTLVEPDLEAPLRVRVRIERHTYLVPCPRQEKNGQATSIRWLAAQAAQRHYQQHGVRPELSLTTSDGALLCSSDPIGRLAGYVTAFCTPLVC